MATGTAYSADNRVLFTLSLLTGNISLDQPSPTTSQTPARPTHLFVYRPRAAKGPPVRIRLAADQPAQELAAGDFLTFEPTSDQPAQVVLLLATGAEVSLVVTPTADAPTYLECRPAGAAPLRQVPAKEGAATITKMVN